MSPGSDWQQLMMRQSILEKCLSVEPEKRYRHAGFLTYELEKGIDGTSYNAENITRLRSDRG